MAQAVKLLTVIDIFFILLLALSGTLGGILGELVYILAFAVVILLGMLGARHLTKERERVAGVRETSRVGIGITGEGLRTLLPLIAPTVAVVFALAFLTSLALESVGIQGDEVAVLPLWQMIISSALLPAVLEELAFRYVPIKLLLPYSPRWCVVISALYFAFIHCNLFQMPYALAAGVVFAVVDIMCDSVMPSVILHFLNNVASIVWIKYATDAGAVAIYIAILVSLVLLSLVFVFVKRRRYADGVRSALLHGTDNVGGSPIMLAVLSVGVAVSNLFI